MCVIYLESGVDEGVLLGLGYLRYEFFGFGYGFLVGLWFDEVLEVIVEFFGDWFVYLGFVCKLGFKFWVVGSF